MISNFEGEPAATTATKREPSIVVFDIETGPRPVAELEAVMPEFEAPANYRDPAKIAEAIDQKRAAWIEKAALSPLTGKVLAIGCLIDGEYRAKIVGDKLAEADVIRWFWSLTGTRTMWIGYNSDKFDLPFLYRRSWALGIMPPLRCNGHGFAGSIDLMKAWGCGDRSSDFISLDTVAKFLGVGAKTGSGGHFADLLKFDIEAAARYLENDVLLTAAVAERMGFDSGRPDVAVTTTAAEPQPAVESDDY